MKIQLPNVLEKPGQNKNFLVSSLRFFQTVIVIKVRIGSYPRAAGIIQKTIESEAGSEDSEDCLWQHSEFESSHRDVTIRGDQHFKGVE